MTIINFKDIYHRLKISIKNLFFGGTEKYWNNRYLKNGNSGNGSYNLLAAYKAEILNRFIEFHEIDKLIEFGCGDGNNLGLINCSKYIGLDISREAIKICMTKFKNDFNKSFFLYNPMYFQDYNEMFRAELTISLDVIFHIVEFEIFEKYMHDLFDSSTKFVIIYSRNKNSKQEFHINNREVTSWIKRNVPNFNLINEIKNKFNQKETQSDLVSESDFYVYKKQN